MSESGVAPDQSSHEDKPLSRFPPQEPSGSIKKVSIKIPVEESPLIPKLDSVTKTGFTPAWLQSGIAIMLFITFLGSLCFSIVLPSLWPFIQEIEKRNGRVPQSSITGWAVAVNSFGSFIASPIIGYWGDRRSTREVIAITLIFMMIGNVLYSLSLNIYMILAGRFIVGAAAANFSVAQTYLAYATTLDTRTLVMTLNSGVSVIGFIAGPAFAYVCSYIDFNIKSVNINSNTAPGYIASIISILGLFSLLLLKEIPKSRKKRRQDVGSGASGVYSGQGSVGDISTLFSMKKLKNVPWTAVLILLYATFAFTAAFTVFETIGTAYTQHEYNWGSRQNGIFFCCLGVLVIVALFILQIFLKLFNDRICLIFTTLMMIGAFLVTVNFDNLQYVGLWRFLSGAGVGAAGFSPACALVMSIYSKVLDKLDQGTLMGLAQSAASISRIVGPLAASYTLQYGGPSIVFLEMCGLLFVAFLALLFGYKKLEAKPTTYEAINS